MGSLRGNLRCETSPDRYTQRTLLLHMIKDVSYMRGREYRGERPTHRGRSGRPKHDR